ncbi:MAG TPA: hypothetical protein VHU15_13755 [Stellaceae bacterium]|nr:hypothetical protein [Stellaceae bacterium]
MTSRLLARCIRRLVIAGAVAGIGGIAIAAISPGKAQIVTGYCAYPAYGPNCEYGYRARPLDPGWPGPAAVFQPPH